MKILAMSAFGAAAIALTASPALAKGHAQPADPAQAFGQENADEKYHIGGEVASVQARDETKGVDGSDISREAQTYEREPADPPKGMPK